MSTSERDSPTNHRGFSFQSKEGNNSAEQRKEDDREFLEQFEEAIAERDQRIEALELQLQSQSQKETSFKQMIENYQVKLIKLQNDGKVLCLDENPQILKEIELHNQNLEDLLSFCEKLDLNGLITLEKHTVDENFLGVEALKRGFEDRLSRITQEFNIKTSTLTENLKSELTEKKSLLSDVKELREKVKSLVLENNEYKQKNLDLNNKIFELNMNLKTLEKTTKTLKNSHIEQESLSKHISENLTKSLLDKNLAGKPLNNEELIEGITEKLTEKLQKSLNFNTQQEKLLEETTSWKSVIQDYMRRIESYTKNEKVYEEELTNLRAKLREYEDSMSGFNDITKELAEKETLLKALQKEKTANSRLIEKQGKELKESKETNKTYESDIQSLKKTLKEFEETNEKYENKLIGLNEINEKHNEFINFKEKSMAYEADIQKLQEKILRLQEEKEEIYRSFNKNTDFQLLLEEKDSLLKALKNDEIMLKSQISSLEAENQSLNNEMLGLKNQMNTYISTISSLEEELFTKNQELNIEINDFTAKNEKLLKVIEEKEDIYKKNNNLKDKLSVYENDIMQLKQKIKSLENENREITMKNQDLSKSLNEKEYAINLIATEKTQIERKLYDKESMIISLSNEKNELLKEKEILNRKIDENKKDELNSQLFLQRLQEKEREKAEILKENSLFQQKNHELQDIISMRTHENDELLKKLSYLEQQGLEIHTCKESQRWLIEEKAKLTKALDIKEANIQQLLKDSKKYEENLRLYESQLSEKTEILNRLSKDLKRNEETIRLYETQLSEKNEIISKKSINIQSLTQAIESKESIVKNLHNEKQGFSQVFQKIINYQHHIKQELVDLRKMIYHIKNEGLKDFSLIPMHFEREIAMYFNELQRKHEDKLLIIQRIYDKKEATYKNTYEAQITQLEKDIESLNKTYKIYEDTAEKPQKVTKNQPLISYYMNPMGPSSSVINPISTASNSMNMPLINENSPNQGNKSEFLNYLSKKLILKNKNSDQNMLFISQTHENINNNKANNTYTYTPKGHQSNSFYVIGDSNSKRNLSEAYPERNSWENAQKEVSDLKKSLSLLHEEHQRLLEVVENNEKSSKINKNDTFAVKCFEKLFDQLAVSLERESQLRTMVQLLDEKITKSAVENQSLDEFKTKLKEKEAVIKSLEQEMMQYKVLCKELQIQLDFKRAQMKFIQQNEPNNSKEFKKSVEISKRDYSLTHNHGKNQEDIECIPNLSINFQKGNISSNTPMIKSPKTPPTTQKGMFFGNKELKNVNVRVGDGGSVKKGAKNLGKGNNINSNQRWI